MTSQPRQELALCPQCGLPNPAGVMRCGACGYFLRCAG